MYKIDLGLNNLQLSCQKNQSKPKTSAVIEAIKQGEYRSIKIRSFAPQWRLQVTNSVKTQWLQNVFTDNVKKKN